MVKLEHQRRTAKENWPFLLASQWKAFDIDLGEQLAPFRIVKAVSDPIYFPLATKELVDVVIEVDLPQNANSFEHQVVGIFLEIDGDLPDFPDPAKVKYKLSRGVGEVFMGNIFPSTLTCFQRSPASAFFYGRPDSFFDNQIDYPNDTMTISRVNPAHPYYFRAYQLKMDYDLDCAGTLRTIEQITKDFESIFEARKQQGFSSIQRISLTCPVTKKRIQRPVRWLHNRTLQCYDRSAVESILFPGNRIDRNYFVDGLSLDVLQNVDESVGEVWVDMETMKWSLWPLGNKRKAEDQLDKGDLLYLEFYKFILHVAMFHVESGIDLHVGSGPHPSGIYSKMILTR